MHRRTLLASCSLFALVALPGCTGSPDDAEDVGEAEQAQVVCPSGATLEGIDVSVYQSDIDWKKVKGAGITFAIARAAYGTSKDTFFDQNWAGMKSAGVIRGAYQYWRPDKDPIAQADAMLMFMGPLDGEDLPPVIDVEETDGVAPADMAKRLGQWLDHVEAATGKKPIIYSGKYFWQDNVKSKAYLDYPYWIPNYSLKCPDLPTGYWPDWQFFQYSSTGKVSGIAGNVDRNQWNGTLDDLKAFASQGGAKYAAKFVSQSFPYAADGPLTMFTGQDVVLSLEMKNTGSATWDESTRLGTTSPRDHESPFAGPEWPGKNRYAQVKGKVAPGETYKFEWTMHPPKTGGLYDEHIGLVQEGVAWFSDPGQGGPPDGQLEGVFEVVNPFDLGGSKDNHLPVFGDGVSWSAGAGGNGGNGSNGGSAGAGSNNSSSQKMGACSTANAGEAPSTGLLFAAMAMAGALSRRRRSRWAN